MQQIAYIYKLLLPYLWNTRRVKIATLLTLFLIAVDVVTATYFPYIWKSIIATDIHSTPTSWFIWMSVTLFIVWTLKKTIPHFREIVFFSVTNQAIKEIRLKTILKSHTISLLDLETYNLQEIISATSRVSQSIRQFMRVSFISIFPSSAKVISLSIALIATDILCFGILSAAYLGLFIAAICLKYYSKTKTKGWHLTDTVTVAMGHSLNNTTSVRFNLQREATELSKLFDQEAKAWEKHNIALYLLYLIQDFIFYIGSGIIFCVIIINYAKGVITLDKLVLIYGLIASMHNPLLEITRNMTRFFGGMVDLGKTLGIMKLPSENKPLKLSDLKPQPIYLDNVSFAYPGKSSILKNINLTINPGDKIGIFGPSGAGKSTLCQIIAGILPPTSGTALHGTDKVWHIQPDSLGKLLCYIPQTHISPDFETHQHEYGIKLTKQPFSGGEHQRYLLRKALEKKPQIIILDETTNALDRKSAHQILQTLLDSIPTVIIVSHRQTTLDQMKYIFELKNGHLQEIHPHLTR